MSKCNNDKDIRKHCHVCRCSGAPHVRMNVNGKRRRRCLLCVVPDLVLANTHGTCRNCQHRRVPLYGSKTFNVQPMCGHCMYEYAKFTRAMLGKRNCPRPSLEFILRDELKRQGLLMSSAPPDPIVPDPVISSWSDVDVFTLLDDGTAARTRGRLGE